MNPVREATMQVPEPRHHPGVHRKAITQLLVETTACKRAFPELRHHPGAHRKAITQLLVETTACKRAAQTTIRTRMTTRGRSQSQTALTTPLPALMTCSSQKTQIWIQTIVLLLIRGVVHGSARLHHSM